MNSKERFEKIKEQYNKSNRYALYISYDDIGFLLNQLTKQEKMIELMFRFIDTELSSEHLSKVLKIEVKPLETYREYIKQYFEKKVDED